MMYFKKTLIQCILFQFIAGPPNDSIHRLKISIIKWAVSCYVSCYKFLTLTHKFADEKERRRKKQRRK